MQLIALDREELLSDDNLFIAYMMETLEGISEGNLHTGLAVAGTLGVSIRTLYSYRNQSKLSGEKVGNKVMYTTGSVEYFLIFCEQEEFDRLRRHKLDKFQLYAV
jgi:hypothetical protein